MSRYDLGASDDYIYYPGTSIPINHLNIKDDGKLRSLEADLLADSYIRFYNQLRDSTIFDEDYLKLLHKKTFESLYTFAGMYRNVDTSKGGSYFCKAKYIQNHIKELFDSLKSDFYLKLVSNKKVLIDKISYYMCELITIHPFPDLNGRIIRMFFDMIAMYHGYEPIDYKADKSQASLENNFIDASILCVQCADTTKLKSIITKGLYKT